jgi:putative spermidine/putrescine transport system substrate-binding protein
MMVIPWKPVLGAGLVAISLAGGAPAGAHEDLTFASWSGPYMRSQMLAFVRPFEKETGDRVEVEFYNGGLEEMRQQVRSANVKWDVIDLLEEDLIRACEAGLLEEIDPAILLPGPDGTPPEEDFIDNGLRPCGVGTMAWATAIGYDPDAFAGEKPQTLADFFDVERFPGQRGLQRDPRIVMEWALLADGVPAGEVYRTLGTPEGVDRALGVMDRIKPYLTWWEEGNDPIDMLGDGRVAITSIWGGEMTDAILQRDAEIAPIWDGLVLKLDHLAVVKGSPNREKAFEFIRFATATEPLAEQVRHIYHSPARQSSMALIGDEIKPYLPTTPEHMASAIENDARFWADNHERLQARFEDWLDVPRQKGVAGAPR